MNQVDFTKNIPIHIKVQNKPDEWRLGQAYFNYAYEMYPTEVNALRGTNYDCYYDDNKIGIFLNELNKQLLMLK